MAFDPKPILQKMQSFLAASGRCPGGTSVGEPKGPPNTSTGVYGAVILGPIRIAELSLKTASARVDIIARLYRDALKEPLEGTEFLLGQTALEIIEDILGDFDFGDDNVRGVVALEMTITLGYQDIGGTVFRVADLVIPVLVNDVATLTK